MHKTFITHLKCKNTVESEQKVWKDQSVKRDLLSAKLLLLIPMVEIPYSRLLTYVEKT